MVMWSLHSSHVTCWDSWPSDTCTLTSKLSFFSLSHVAVYMYAQVINTNLLHMYLYGYPRRVDLLDYGHSWRVDLLIISTNLKVLSCSTSQHISPLPLCSSNGMRMGAGELYKWMVAKIHRYTDYKVQSWARAFFRQHNLWYLPCTDTLRGVHSFQCLSIEWCVTPYKRQQWQ